MTTDDEGNRIIVEDLPPHVHGLTVLEDDYYTILINSKLSVEMQRDAYIHEREHIRLMDFEKDAEAGDIEEERHRKL